MKFPSSISKILENKYVLYIVFFLAVTNVFGYIVMRNLKAVGMFILVGYLVYCFNKNMIIVLGVPLIFTSLFVSSGVMREGVDDTLTPENKMKMKETKHAVTPSPDQKTQMKKEIKKEIKKEVKKGALNTDTVEPGSDGEQTGDETTTDETQPADSSAGMTTMYKKNNRVDYAATVEDAYDDLNKILGGDGIKRLTDDTQKLMGQQMQLAEAMKSMTPLLEQAKSLIGNFDMKQFGNIADMAKQFAPAK
jgi:hypothetical protein